MTQLISITNLIKIIIIELIFKFEIPYSQKQQMTEKNHD